MLLLEGGASVSPAGHRKCRLSSRKQRNLACSSDIAELFNSTSIGKWSLTFTNWKTKGSDKNQQKRDIKTLK
uniref:Uncharacterized protein n=1 Tax=Knipowitschia caucasica TaxID=637954 RepID=A0AAV2LW62_KNICA